MDVRRRTDRAAAVIVAAEGLFLVVVAAWALFVALPDLGSGDPHRATDAGMGLIIVGVPMVAVGLLALLLGLALWHGRPTARILAAAFVAVAGLFSWTQLTGFGNALWAARTVILEHDRVQVRWPFLYYDPFLGTDVTGTPIEAFPFARLDSLLFWFPGIVAAGAIIVGFLLLAGWVAGRARGAGSGMPSSGETRRPHPAQG